MSRIRLLAVIVLSVTGGFLFGAASIRRPIPNAPLELPPARNPWNPKDILGLIGSLGIRTLAGHLEKVPPVVLETDRIFVLSVPDPRGRVHYVLVPKKDIRDIGGISAEDEPYLMEVLLTARHLVEKDHLHDYRLFTNGPGQQSVSYLHFHLVGKKPAGS
jgi:histidine triad (HIT) family protein